MFSPRGTLLSFLAASLTLVHAHGSVSFFGAGGRSWVGPWPGSGSDQDSPVRTISTLEPIPNPNSSDMTCGRSPATTAKVVAEVKAGDSVDFGWRSGVEGTPWPHLYGPVMLYAYQCSGDAASCAGDGAGWALIDAAGYTDDGSTWVQNKFHTNENVPARIPSGMPNGDYLLRHEIIALHVIPAEFYVSCTQIRVVGGSNGTLADLGAELVAFPGAYSGSEPGLTANVFGGVTKDTYQFPGPKLFAPDGSSAPTESQPEPPTSCDASRKTKRAAPVRRHRSARRHRSSSRKVRTRKMH